MDNKKTLKDFINELGNNSQAFLAYMSYISSLSNQSTFKK